MLSHALVQRDSNCDLDSYAWCRTTDFTGNFLIGQAFAYMVEINSRDERQEARLIEILNFRDNLEHGGTFLVERGIPYAISQEVVPILRLEKLQKYPVPLDLIFKLNYLIQHGKLNATNFDDECAKLVIRGAEGHVRTALETISELPPQHDILNSRTLLISALEDAKLQFPNPPDLIAPSQGRAWIYRLLITPTKAYCMEPEVESCNRMIRLYEKHAENFLRVNFVDEDLCPLNGTSLVSAVNTSYSPLYRRIRKVLKEGFSIGNKRYEFLAFSASQLREGQIWMFAEVMMNGKPHITADTLRADMGDFSQIRNVAKCAARMGQCFSSSRKSLSVLPLQLKKIQDIFVTTDDVKYCFSDGIGKISADFARKVAATCGCGPGKVPSAFQIRYGGYKGVVAIDPDASNSFKLYLRPSMRKFDSAHFGVEVLEWTHVMPCYLNRQAISLLSTLGVEDRVFMNLQDQIVLKWCKAVNDETLATKLLMETASNSMALKLLSSGFTYESELLLRRLMLAYMHAQFNDIRTRARIFVPEGRMLIGCLDETGILEYGQAFVKISSNAEEIKSKTVSTVRVIQEEIIVLKNPCLHPGDVRVLQCVNVPQLQHMVDCIVFPRRGQRPHPNECSGSDLDGDMYLVSWDQSLLPPEVDAPMNYESPPAVILNRRVTIEDIQKFFVDYLVNDNLGYISNAHVVHCDREPEKARSPKCLELAQLASIAVDFPKTGVPAIIPYYLRPKEYPDFMEKEHKATYVSQGVLGKLYRATNDFPKPAEENFLESTRLTENSEPLRFCDPDLVIREHGPFVEQALNLKYRYDAKLMKLMNQYGIKDEMEILGGHIVSLSTVYKRRQKETTQKILLAFERLQKEARFWFHQFKEWKKLGLDKSVWVSAWYVATYHSDYYGRHKLQYSEVTNLKVYLISFPWTLSDMLCRLKSKGCIMVKPYEGSNHFSKHSDPALATDLGAISDDCASENLDRARRLTSSMNCRKRKANDREELVLSTAHFQNSEIAEKRLFGEMGGDVGVEIEIN
ncbi:RNA-dependent RNA polymerase [Marchantia polymorpha subsp. ruderalis]|nr:hypothetical protein MARPO_0189s0015 [Marchantia polymorpha]BBN10782.1 hypothetical protein Mp_5g06390 [Marchantia polymorpha subsp. ruderalis]|eukprot:PTQ27642.1 hypothetical protein MARPO_0189s0015 [Marchantia polymorpha]